MFVNSIELAWPIQAGLGFRAFHVRLFVVCSQPTSETRFIFATATIMLWGFLTA